MNHSHAPIRQSLGNRFTRWSVWIGLLGLLIFWLPVRATNNPAAITAELSSATTCAGQVVELTASGGNSYTFSTGLTNTTGLLTISPTATTVYSVTVSDGSGITATATGTVTVDPKPEIGSESLAICQGERVQLTTIITGYATLQNPVFREGSANGPVVVAPDNVTPAASIVYYLTAQNSSGCSGTATVSITVNTLPAANPASLSICAGGASQGVFDLTSLNSRITGGASNAVTFFTDINQTMAIATPQSYTSTGGTLYAEVTNPATGCSRTVALALFLSPAPACAPITFQRISVR